MRICSSKPLVWHRTCPRHSDRHGHVCSHAAAVRAHTAHLGAPPLAVLPAELIIGAWHAGSLGRKHLLGRPHGGAAHKLQACRAGGEAGLRCCFRIRDVACCSLSCPHVKGNKKHQAPANIQQCNKRTC